MGKKLKLCVYLSERRCKNFIDKMNGIKDVSARMPEGAFYGWVKVEKTDMNIKQICEYILDEAYVSVVPGDAFGCTDGKHFRVSCATGDELMEEAAERIKLALDKII